LKPNIYQLFDIVANNNEDSLSQPTPEQGLLNFSVQMQPGNAWFSEEPELKEESSPIWKSQVLIPHSNSTHAYLGPIEKLKVIFTRDFH